MSEVNKRDLLLKFAKFGLVGVTNTVLSLLIYYLLLQAGTNYLVASATGYILSSIVGYLLNRAWVFRKKKDGIKKTIGRYYLVYGSSLLLNLLCMFFFVKVVGISDKFAPIITVVITTIYNFVLSNNWVFRDKKISLSLALEWMKRHKTVSALWLAVMFILVPLFVNNLYNHPVADDYSNYNLLAAHLPSEGEHEASDYVKAVVERTTEIYSSWQGTYASNVMFAISPLLIENNLYRLTMAAIQLFYIFSVCYFFFALQRIFEPKGEAFLKICPAFIGFSLLCMYSLAEGLYWMTGTILYIIPFSLSLILFGAILKYNHTANLKYLIIGGLLTIALGGTSYVTGLLVGFVLLMNTIYNYSRKTKTRHGSLALLLIFVVGFYFNISCPGNSARISDRGEMSLVRTAYISLINAISMLGHVLFETLFLPFFLFCLPLLSGVTKKIKPVRRPFAVLVLSFLCFVSFFSPMAYAYNSFYQETRVMNIQFLYLVLIILACAVVILSYYRANFRLNGALVAVSAILLISAISVDGLPGFSMINDVVMLRSRHYDACMNEIEAALSKDGGTEVEVAPCPEYATSLHHFVFLEGDWRTSAVEKFYNKKIIVKDAE